MNQIKALVHDIHNGKKLESNLLKYKMAATTAYNDYAALELTFSAYTMMQEVKEEKPELAVKEQSVIQTICDALTGLGRQKEYSAVMADMMALRQEITAKMDLFTAYTDRLICYEYVLNRMELKYLPASELNQKLAVFDDTSFLNQMMLYLFNTKDQSVIKDKLRLVVGQIPVHMTKSKLFEKIGETMTLYKSGAKRDLDDFVYMLRTSAMLYEPEKYVGEYPDFEEVLDKLAAADYVNMPEDEYNQMTDLLEDGARAVHEITDFYYSLQKVVNGIYALCLALPYQSEESQIVSAAKEIWSALAGGTYQDEMLIPFEGKIENYVERTSYLESVLFEIKTSYKKELETMELTPFFDDFSLVANLLSDSLFIDLDAVEKNEMADSNYVQQQTERLLDELSERFQKVSKPIKKAMMGQILEKLPTLFNNTDEVQEYIRLNLLGCQDKAEKCIVMSILSDLTQEEQEW